MQEDRIEQLAQDLWPRLAEADIEPIAQQYGFPVADLRSFDWSVLPEAVKDRVRDLVEDRGHD
jgi:hypothetical protein